MAPESKLHLFFFSYLARGHLLPILNAASLFADRGCRCSLVTTPANASYLRPLAATVDILVVPFPADAVGLPVGHECTDVIPSDLKNSYKLFNAINLLQHDFKNLAVEHRPDCIVADPTIFFVADIAESLSIPLYHFCTFSPFTECIVDRVLQLIHSDELKEHDSASTVGPLVGLPRDVVLTRAELHSLLNTTGFFDMMQATEKKGCGVLFNSFDEMAPEYVDLYRETVPGRVFCVGPVQARKQIPDWDGHVIKNWLDSKPQGSVVYISFGSQCEFRDEQLREIALGLASCKHRFIWVVRGGSGEIDDWLPEEFRAATESGKGLMVTEWAPQVAILQHPATGGFLTHCGWSSVLEAVCAGLPVIAWPLVYEQFMSETLVVEVMGVAVRVLEGPEMRSADRDEKQVVTAAAVAAAVDKLMGGGEEVEAMRAAAAKYAEMARAATEEGGSSYQNLSSVIQDMRARVDGDL